MKPFSFVHSSDLHLGYSQYGLDVRREDFDTAFEELVEKTIRLKPDFMIVAGDIFHHARPSNITLENAIQNFSRLREAEIPVLTVDGSHDSAPNIVTGTILNPLDSAGLIYYLPRHRGACWRKPDCCYVYGVPNFRTRRRTEELLPLFMRQSKPEPEADFFNIFVFHMALDLSSVNPPHIEAEASPELIPEGFNYYAGGHVHVPYKERFKTGILAYSGSTETVNYAEAKIEKGFHYVEVNERGRASPQFMRLESLRKFAVLEHDFSGVTPSKTTEMTVQLVKGVDEDEVIVIPVLKGILPAGANRAEIDITQIKSAAERALLVHPIVLLHESEVSEEIVRSIFESEFKDLKTKVFEYFFQFLSERYDHDESEKIAHVAVNLIDPLTKKQQKKVRQSLEGLLSES